MNEFKNLLDPSQLQANAIMKAEAKRLSEITNEIIELLIEKEITTQELSKVVLAINTLMNNKIEKIKIKDLIKNNNGRK